MTNINYNEFQPGQGVSAPDLNENFTLTNNALETMEVNLNTAISSITSTTNLKANKNGSNAEVFNVANATNTTEAVNLGQLNNIISQNAPTGSIMWYGGQNPPTGYLLCDGREVSRTTYANLFNVVTTKFGAGNGSTTFNLPNLIGRFIKGSTSIGHTVNGINTVTENTEHTHGYVAGNMMNYVSSAQSTLHYHGVDIKSLEFLPCIKA